MSIPNGKGSTSRMPISGSSLRAGASSHADVVHLPPGLDAELDRFLGGNGVDQPGCLGPGIHLLAVDPHDQVPREEAAVGGAADAHDLHQGPGTVVPWVLGHLGENDGGGIDLALVHLRDRPLLFLRRRQSWWIDELLVHDGRFGIDPCDESPQRGHLGEPDRGHHETPRRRVGACAVHVDQGPDLAGGPGPVREEWEGHPPRAERGGGEEPIPAVPQDPSHRSMVAAGTAEPVVAFAGSGRYARIAGGRHLWDTC
jgi:hypothetical protein